MRIQKGVMRLGLLVAEYFTKPNDTAMFSLVYRPSTDFLFPDLFSDCSLVVGCFAPLSQYLTLKSDLIPYISIPMPSTLKPFLPVPVLLQFQKQQGLS